MSTQVFPSLLSQFRRTRQFEWNTTIFESVAGKEYREAKRLNPRSTFELAYDLLQASTAGTDWATLVGFFNARQGDYDSFLISAADDSAVTGQLIAIGDGSNKTFQLIRTLGSATETILAPNVVSHVYDAGVDSGGWTVSSWGSAAPGVVTYAVAPANGHAITVDFSYYFPVRFLDPVMDLDRFMNMLWSAASIKVKQLL